MLPKICGNSTGKIPDTVLIEGIAIGFWCPGEVMALPIGTSDKHKPHKTKGIASF